MKPELLAIRAVNQYRDRDILAYLGLRYYLESTCARRDVWSQNIATHLVNTRDRSAYLISYHFKEIAKDGVISHRKMFLPGPNEILAEAALIDQCAKYDAFHTLPCVFSYKFPDANNNAGIFQKYFLGFKSRHDSIAETCKELNQRGVVWYTDIVQFYPSIPKHLAMSAWEGACNDSGIPSHYRSLGEKLLSNYSETLSTAQEGASLLVGPMFSHVIANLVFREIDRKLSLHMNGRYWRYVDDIVMAGEEKEVAAGRQLLSSLLSDMGLRLHTGEKDLHLDAEGWLKGANDFNNTENLVWINLVANIKRFLLVRPDERLALQRVFEANGMNFDLLNYGKVESFALQKFLVWLKRYSPWSRECVRSLTPEKLLAQAQRARQEYLTKIKILLSKGSSISGYERKRLVTKLRYYAGRLLFLCPVDSLRPINKELMKYRELSLMSAAIAAVDSYDVTQVLSLGSNAVQSVAQLFRSRNKSAVCSLESFGDVERQGLAILMLNGIRINFKVGEGPHLSDSLNRFASGEGMLDLMGDSRDLFIQELACLHGASRESRHVDLLNTAFHEDEQLAFDVINQLHGSSY